MTEFQPQSVKQRALKRWGALKTERASWDSHWMDLSKVILPRNGRFFVTDRNKGDKRHNAIYDNTATKALRVLSAGMMAGMTSPARPWFRLSVPDPDLMDFEPVKVWLALVQRMMLDIFASSNTYRALHSMYEELGTFGTAAALVAPNFKNVIHLHTLTAGQYALASDFDGSVNTLYREFQKPVEAVVGEFGVNKVSQQVKTLYDRGDYDKWVTIVHAVQPRKSYDPAKRDNLNMLFSSCYFDPADTDNRLLRESGFEEFPGLGPRWGVTGEDIYGVGPGGEALGDIKQLQHEQLRKGQGIDYQVKPPMQGPTSFRGQESNMLPGGFSYVDQVSANGGIRPAFEANIRLDYLLADIVDVRERIRSSFFADLFLMLAQSANNSRMTATEVAERHEEKMLMLGPVLERLHNELLKPLIDQTFAAIVRAGVLPPPPPELQGLDIGVNFVSMLAQAQRAVSTNATDRWLVTIGAVAALKPEVYDNVDVDYLAEEYADQLGVNPKLIVPSKTVALIRKQRADAQAQAQQAALAESQSKTMAQLGSADTNGDIMNQFSGYGSPGPYNY